MMRFLRRKPVDRFEVRLLDPWEINGEPTDADSAGAVVEQIRGMAEVSPVEVVFVREDGDSRSFVLTETGLVDGTLEDYQAHQEELVKDPEPTPDPEPEHSEQDPAPVAVQSSLADDVLGEAEADAAQEEIPAAAPVVPVKKSRRGSRRVTTATGAPVAVPAPTPDDEETTAEVQDPGPAADPDDEGRAPEVGRPAGTRRRVILVAAAAGVAVLTVGGVAAAVMTTGEPETTSASAEPVVAVDDATGVELGEGTVVGATPNAVYLVTGGELIAHDPETGDTLGDPVPADDAEAVRIATAGDTDLIATSDTGYYTLRSETTDDHDGRLLLRGSTPVVTNDGEYAVGAATDFQDVPRGSAVFGAVDDQPVFAKAPATVVIDGEETALDQPGEDATIASWEQVSAETVVVTWDNDDQTVLAIHAVGSGKILDQTEVAADDIGFRHGLVTIGTDRYVTGDSIQELCDGGQLASGVPVCPTEAKTWETPTGSVATHQPRVVSDDYYVDRNNTIWPLNQP